MRKLLALYLLSLLTICVEAQTRFQLAPPLIAQHSSFFADTTSFSVRFNQPGTAVYYTMENRDPTNKDSQYIAPVSINKACTIRLRAIGDDFLPSETILLHFHKTGLPIKSITTSQPNEFYAKLPANILHDAVGGIPNFRSGTWLGFDNDTVWIDIQLPASQQINTVSISLLQDENSWIFLPAKTELFYRDINTDNWSSIAIQKHMHNEASPKTSVLQLLKLNKPILTEQLRLMLVNIDKIPEWHAAKGNNAWIFVDEVLVK